MLNGISCIVCCYNSEDRLQNTLAFLAAQEVRPQIPWEIIVVDNASTDNTAKIAKESWPPQKSVPLFVVYEAKQGLLYARLRGLQKAAFDVVCFVDDDNWLSPDWIQTAWDILQEHPDVGAVAGDIDPEFDSITPEWLERYYAFYAVGPQADTPGYTNRAYFWGAGLALRKSAWQQIQTTGFTPRLGGREGAKMIGGEDIEICTVLRWAGWRLWYDPRLRLRHYLRSARITWQHLRERFRGIGEESVYLDGYRLAAEQGLRHRLKRYWFVQLTAAVLRLLLHRLSIVMSLGRSLEGDDRVRLADVWLGRCLALVKIRREYHHLIDSIYKDYYRIKGIATSGNIK
jgi:glycosyltransferase involved in cell wall biosynthesis